MEALEHVHELIPTHMKRSQEIHQISEELMSEHAMRKAMIINTRQAHRRATSQIPQESNTRKQVGEVGEAYSDSGHEI
jgi:ribosomal protein L17